MVFYIPNTYQQHAYRYTHLVKEGWTKDDLHLSPWVITKAKTALTTKTKRNYQSIFLKHILRMGILESINDKSRFQRFPYECNAEWFNEIKLHLSEKLNTIHSNLKIVFWSVLLSEPGGQIQREHTDYPSDLPFPVFSGIVSIDDSTTLNIRDGNMRRCVRILAGECLIFNGNVIHSGSSYSTQNRRLFFKAIPYNCSLPEVEDYNVTVMREYCEHCHYSFKSRYEKEYHNTDGVCPKTYLTLV